MIIEWVKQNLWWLVLLLPAGFVIWEGSLLSLTGDSRHWRRFGLSLYIAGFSMALGTCFRGTHIQGETLLAVFFILVVIGGGLPLVAVLIREDARGRLVVSRGAWIARVLGVFAYSFCAYLVIEIG